MWAFSTFLGRDSLLLVLICVPQPLNLITTIAIALATWCICIKQQLVFQLAIAKCLSMKFISNAGAFVSQHQPNT